MSEHPRPPRNGAAKTIRTSSRRRTWTPVCWQVIPEGAVTTTVLSQGSRRASTPPGLQREHLAIATDERQGRRASEVIEPYRGQYPLECRCCRGPDRVPVWRRGRSINALRSGIGATFQDRMTGGDFTMRTTR